RQRPPAAAFGSSRLRDAIVWLVCLKIVLALLWLWPEGFDAFQVPKALVGHVVAVPMALCLAFALYEYGHRIVPRSWLFAPVALYVAAAIAATVAAQDPYLALHGDIVTVEGLAFVLEMVVLLLAVAVAFRDLRDWRRLGIAAAGAMAVVVGYAALQALGLDMFRWAADARARTISTLGNAEVLGLTIGTALGVVLGALAVSAERRLALGLALASAALILAGGTTGTRGFLVSFVAAVVAAVAVRVATSRAGRARVLVGGAIAALALTLAVMLLTPVGARIAGSFTGEEPLEDRLVVYRTALDAYLDRPLLGWGPGNFEAASVAHRPVALARLFGPRFFYTNAHDLFVEAFVATGTAGGLALLTLAVMTAVALARGLARQALVAGPALCGLVGYGAQAIFSVGSVAIDWYPWLAAGAAIAVTAAGEDPRAARIVPSRVVASVIGAVALLALFASLPAYSANEDAGRSRAAREANAALEAATRAVTSDPGRARYWERQGLAFAAASRNRDAARAFGEAAARAPYHAEHWNNMAISLALQAGTDRSSPMWKSALSAIDEGLRRDPKYPPLLYTSAFVREQLNENDAAVELAAQAIVLYAGDAMYDALLARIAGKASVPAATHATAAALEAKDSVALRFAAAQTALRAGDRDAARVHVERIVNVLDPANAQARELLARIVAGG
ncbi:MAG: hypothetical protein AUG02_02255, partial [Chloroflexi bacterium 13_1_20CM_2_70_9]